MIQRSKTPWPRKHGALLCLAAAAQLLPCPAPAASDDLPIAVAIDMLARGQGTEALPALQRLAHENNARAQYTLGTIYLEGKWAPIDRAQGAAWLQIVAAGYPGIDQRELVLDAARDLLAKVSPGLTGLELIKADRITADFIADWQQKWALDYATAKAMVAQNASTAQSATAVASNGLPLAPGCALDPKQHGCWVPKEFNATEHCTGTLVLKDSYATADPDKGAKPRPLPPPGLEGTVTLRVHVDRTGLVCFTTVVRSSGNAKLDRAVLDSINRWRLVPARQGTTDVESLHLIMLTQHIQ